MEEANATNLISNQTFGVMIIYKTISSNKYLYQYKPVLERIYMIYLSLNCKWQLHYYHLQGKYRLPDLYGAYCINFT